MKTAVFQELLVLDRKEKKIYWIWSNLNVLDGSIIFLQTANILKVEVTVILSKGSMAFYAW